MNIREFPVFLSPCAPTPLYPITCQTRIQRMKDEYAGVVNDAAARIRAKVPANLIGKF